MTEIARCLTTVACGVTLTLADGGCRTRDYEPHLGGFTLGTLHSADQGRIACHAMPVSASDSLWLTDNPDLANSLRWCTAADTVALLYARDTLVSISVRVATPWRDAERVIDLVVAEPHVRGLGIPSCYAMKAERRASGRHVLPRGRFVLATMSAWLPGRFRWWHETFVLSHSDSLVNRFGAPATPGPGLVGFVAISSESVNERFRCVVARHGRGEIQSIRAPNL